ncbi:MAG: sulfurtransferase TusA family protein [Thiotrichales bacterium]
MTWFSWHWLLRPSTVSLETRFVALPRVGTVSVSRSADCLGASCPRPQLLAKSLLEQMAEGEVLEVVSDNPTSVETLPALAMVLYCTHLATLRDGQVWRIYLRKGL